MEKDILNKLKMNSRDEVVGFLESLWAEKPQPCPLCGGKLDFFHKKATVIGFVPFVAKDMILSKYKKLLYSVRENGKISEKM